MFLNTKNVMLLQRGCVLTVIIFYQDAGVDVQLDLRLYFREITNKQRHTAEAQEREEKCVRELQTMLCNHGNTTSY